MGFKVRSLLLLATTGLVSLVSLHAQPIGPAKVAIINAQKAVADTQEIKKAQATLEAKYRPRTQQIETLQRDVQSLQQQLRAPNMTPEKEAQLTSEGTRKQKDLQRMSEDLQSDLDHERQDILGKTGRQMQEVVRKLAEERNLDMVVDVTNTIYFRPALEITSEATAAYDKAYPAK